VGGDAHRQLDGALGAELLGDRERGLHGCPLAADHHLARRVAIGDAEDPVGRGALDKLRQPRIVKADMPHSAKGCKR
jgi:hypothetical protein